MEDKIEIVGKGTLIQHGKLNDRIYLMKLNKDDYPDILNALREIAMENNYSKIFCKVPGWATPFFLSNGYVTEAYIPRFFRNSESVFFLSKYLNSDRFCRVENSNLLELGQLLRAKLVDTIASTKPSLVFDIKRLGKSDVEQITNIYRMVFLSYPFPIHDNGYVSKTMQENVWYFGVEQKEKLIAISSAEIDFEGGNAEMTDFATLPDFRGLNLAQELLVKMEK